MAVKGAGGIIAQCAPLSSMAAPDRRLVARILDRAHQATVVFLIGSSVFLMGTIGMNVYNRGKIHRERTAQAMAEQAERSELV